MALFLLLPLVLSYLSLCVLAIPVWDGNVGGTAIGALVTGATYIEALGAVRGDQLVTRHLSLPFPGQPGNLTIAPTGRVPLRFYIKNNQLWQFVNDTTIYHVSVINTTTTHLLKSPDIPMQLVANTRRHGLSGSWKWKGTMLHYEHPASITSGLYYWCQLDDGTTGLFMFFRPAETPQGCSIYTLHSFLRQSRS